MSDLREFQMPEPEVSSNRSKLLGAAVVALGLGALGAYAFASGDAAQPASLQVATNQVRTTPDYGGQNVPPPVTATPVGRQPVMPQSEKPKLEKKAAKPKPDHNQQAVVQPKEPVAAPTPLQTPPENAAPSQQPTDTQPSETPPADQTAQPVQPPPQ